MGLLNQDVRLNHACHLAPIFLAVDQPPPKKAGFSYLSGNFGGHYMVQLVNGTPTV